MAVLLRPYSFYIEPMKYKGKLRRDLFNWVVDLLHRKEDGSVETITIPLSLSHDAKIEQQGVDMTDELVFVEISTDGKSARIIELDDDYPFNGPLTCFCGPKRECECMYYTPQEPKEELPIHRQIGDKKTTICKSCQSIITQDFTEDLFCEPCIIAKNVYNEYFLNEPCTESSIKTAIAMGYRVGLTKSLYRNENQGRNSPRN